MQAQRLLATGLITGPTEPSSQLSDYSTQRARRRGKPFEDRWNADGQRTRQHLSKSYPAKEGPFPESPASLLDQVSKENLFGKFLCRNVCTSRILHLLLTLQPVWCFRLMKSLLFRTGGVSLNFPRNTSVHESPRNPCRSRSIYLLPNQERGNCLHLSKRQKNQRQTRNSTHPHPALPGLVSPSPLLCTFRHTSPRPLRQTS